MSNSEMSSLSNQTGYSVVMSCADKRHSFRTARAAVDAGVLKRFYTGIYYNPRRWEYALLDRVLNWRHSGYSERLHGYRDDALDSYVTTVSWPLFLFQFASRLPGMRKTALQSLAGLTAETLFDSMVASFYLEPADIFHGFGRYSLQSLKRAKSLGAITLLDQPEIHPCEMQKIEEEESRIVNLRQPTSSRVRQHSIQRRKQEIEAADYILVGGDFVKQSLLKYGVPEYKIFVVPYGANIDKIERPIPHTSRSDKFTLLHVGPLTWFRGLHYLLDAFENLCLPNAKLIVIGAAHPAWGSYFADRIATIPNVELIPGVPHTELLRYYSEADVFVFPSLVGGLGMVLYEAMSTGLPVIVSNGDVVIRDGIDGLVAPPTTAGALETAILRLYQNDSLRAELGRQAQQRVTEFGWDAYRRGIAQAYDVIMSQRSAMTK
jgi:alpha-maltose-1-phosphate synthase